MKILKKLWLLPVALMVAGTFGACCDYEEESLGGNVPEPEKQPVSVVGGWLGDGSNPAEGILSMSESVYNEDGTYWANVIYINVEGDINLNVIYEGTYTYKKDMLSEKYVSSINGSNVIDDYKVLFLDKYTLKTEYNSSIEVKNRIVESHNVEVGAEVNFAYSDADFTPSSFTSTDEKIATVDENGMIKALKRGIAYIKAHSSVGTVVAKVVVSDSDNYIDDFIDDISAPIETVISKYGSYCSELNDGPSNVIHYYFADNLMSDAYLYALDGFVNSVTVRISMNADFNKIHEMFGNKYELIGEEETRKIYASTIGEQKINIVVDEEKMAVYYEIQKKSYEKIDDVLFLTIDEAVAKFGVELLDTDDYSRAKSIKINDEYVERVAFLYDPSTRKIQNVQVYVNPNWTEAEVEKWYEDKYYRTVSMAPAADFCDNEVELQSRLFINVSYNEKYGKLIVSYAKDIQEWEMN